MNDIKRKYAMKAIALFTVMLSLLFTLSGCASVDKDDATLDIEQVEFNYHEETNITTVYCTVAIQNDTIYNISSFEMNVGVYFNGEKIETEPLSYKHRVKYGEEDSVTLTFTVSGEVDEVALTSWTPCFETIFKTHINVIVAVAALILLGLVSWILDLFS